MFYFKVEISQEMINFKQMEAEKRRSEVHYNIYLYFLSFQNFKRNIR